MKYVIGDTHFYHRNMIIKNYCGRPFPTIECNNQVLYYNWNDKIKPKDEVIINGDLALQCSVQQLRFLLKNLNGIKYFVLGSHDKKIWQCRDLVKCITPQLETKIAGVHTTINHYKMEVWPRSHYNAWHLYAHSHHHKGCLRPTGKSWCVSVENINYTPISEEEIEAIMEKRPNNFNYLYNNIKK